MKTFSTIALVLTSVVMSGCAGVTTSAFNYDDKMKINVPQKTEECFDAAVLLGANVDRTKEILVKVIAAFDAKIYNVKPEWIRAVRNDHMGVFVGSGNEELFFSWKSTAPDQTFVTVATKLNPMGIAGQKPWSCKIVDEVAKMAQ